MLREGRLELGEHVLLEPNVWLTAQAPARIRIGGGTFLNLGVQVAAVELVEIGEHCMLANGCFVTDGNHRFDDPEKPVPWQGFTSKGPTRMGDNVWLGANVVVTSGVTIGERCVIGRQLGGHHRPAALLDRRRRPPRCSDGRASARGVRPGRTPQVSRRGRRSPSLREHDLHAEDDGGGEQPERDHRQRGVGDRRRSCARRAPPR